MERYVFYVTLPASFSLHEYIHYPVRNPNWFDEIWRHEIRAHTGESSCSNFVVDDSWICRRALRQWIGMNCDFIMFNYMVSLNLALKLESN